MFASPTFHISAIVRWADEHFFPCAVLAKGDPERGLLLIVQPIEKCGVKIWVQTTMDDGSPAWRQRFDENPSVENAQAFIDRERVRDEDLWVLEVEGTQGDLPPVLSLAN